MRIRRRIFGCHRTGKHVWSAISSGEVGSCGVEDAGEFLSALTLRVAKDFNRRGRGERLRERREKQVVLAFDTCLITSLPIDGDRKVPLPSAFGARLRDDTELFR